MREILRKFKVRGGSGMGFDFAVCEPTTEERFGNGLNRETLTVIITARATMTSITLPVGSPMYGEWDENRAARSAISFASEPSCHDNPLDREWSETYGEELTNACYCHGVLGKELRSGD